MAELGPLDLTTRQEKIIAVAAALGSVILHVMLIFGNRDFWPNREEKKKQLMIIHRIPERTMTEVPPAAGAPSRKVYSRSEAAVAEKDQKVESRESTRPPEQRTSEAAPDQKSALPDESIGPLKKPNTISIFTDISEAFFRLEGPASSKGAGTFWERKGLPPGEYKVTFGTVEGYKTPEPQTAVLAEGGSVTFVGRYTKMTQVSVNLNVSNSSFKIIRPDGHYLDLKGNSQGLFKDLPEGSYTIVYDDLPGFSTPGPQSQNLGRGGTLQFSGYYSPGGTGDGGGRGGGSGGGGSGLGERRAAPKSEAKLDRRVRVVVTNYAGPSYETPQEIPAGFIGYPESIIRKSNFQEGWCQVYLILRVDDQGNIKDISVARPKADEREHYALLIGAVEQAVRGWQYSRMEAEVHVDARFYVER